METYFENHEENLDYYSKRDERLSMICRVRYLLSRVNSSMNLYNRSYYILKYAIANTYLYTQEHRLVEDGEEKEMDKIDTLRP